MIDMTAIGAMTASVSAARQIASAMVGVRDFNKMAESVSGLNAQLLKAQEALLTHNTSLLQIQQENFELTKRVRNLEEAANERGRYSLVSVGDRQFAYRSNPVPTQSGASEPVSSEPEHYLCQACFDKGRKVVLQGFERWGAHMLACSVCNSELNTGHTPPQERIQYRQKPDF